MPELANQRVSGTPMSERDCYQQAIYHARALRDCMRGLAILRADDANHARAWLSIVQNLDMMQDLIQKLMVRGVWGNKLVLPTRFRE